jgi:radical SAM family uncharacterized protein/radical SAM-linked protein
MSKKSVQDIMARVQKPSRYMGTEINSIEKDFDSAQLRMVLAFPDLYEIGTSHFGVQILYHLLNRHPKIVAERVFAPAADMENELRQRSLALFSLESQHSLTQFDIIGFSLLYELNYTNVLNMLDLAQIPLRWSQRGPEHPLVVAGGPCVCNPEPVADFFDAMVFGDGEQVVLQMAEIWMTWKAAGGNDKSSLLLQWSALEGVYIPRFFEARYDAQGFQHLVPAGNTAGTISRTIVADLDQAYFPKSPVIPFGKPVHDRLRVEISRGCSRGCRFCQAGMIYRPVRERSARTILDLVRQALDRTGYDDLSLLSLSTGDYTCLAPLMENLMQLCHGDRVAVSLPSVRAGSLSSELMKLIRTVRKTGFTIAPEAGTQRLRDVINKNITDEDVVGTVRDAFEQGWRVIKLYFMIGLPTETDADLEAIVDMVRRLRAIRGPRRAKGQINVSISTFVPKPHTPFQWASQITLDESWRKLEYLKAELKIGGVRLKWQHPEMSLLEGALARGDRRMGRVIEQAWKSGCTFDGWTDQFHFRQWLRAFENCGVDAGFFTTRARQVEEPLPWMHMDAGVDADYLKTQWHDAHQRRRVTDCRHGECHGCGVCDFSAIRPRVFRDCPTPSAMQTPCAREKDDNNVVWRALSYTKLGQARFFGHLELSNIFARAARRAKIGVQYSKGFHPKPRLSFDDPLPLGVASEAEQMRILVSAESSCAQIVQGINAYLPEGVRITGCRMKSEARKAGGGGFDRFRIDLQDIGIDGMQVRQFMESEQWVYHRSRHKGSDQVLDLKSAVTKVELQDDDRLYMEIDNQARPIVRPSEFLTAVLGLTQEALQGVVVTKLAFSPVPSKNCSGSV